MRSAERAPLYRPARTTALRSGRAGWNIPFIVSGEPQRMAKTNIQLGTSAPNELLATTPRAVQRSRVAGVGPFMFVLISREHVDLADGPT